MKKLFFITFILLFAATLFAQTAPVVEPVENTTLSLDEALTLALKKNVSIKREEISLGAAERASAHSWNSLLPSVSISANDEIEFPNINNFGVEGKVSLSLSSDFIASMKKAKLDYEAKKISFDEAILEITATVKESYFSLLLAKQNLDFFKENLESAKVQAEQNEERYRRGTLSEMEYLSSKLSYEKLKPELKAQELSYQKELKTFCLFLGLDDEAVILNGSLEDFIAQYAVLFDDAKKTAISEAVKNGNIPSILNLKKQLEAALKDISVTRLASYGPSANLSYSINPVINGSEKTQIKQSASIGISLPLENLLPFSKGADSIQTAKDSVNDLQLQLTEKSKCADAEYSHIIQSLSQKEESLESLKNFVNLAQKNYEATKFAYSKGMTEFLSMQNASKENLEAKMNLQNELLETLKLYISLEKLYGGK